MSLFGAEIWGWRKEERIYRIQRKYVKWTGKDNAKLYINRRRKTDDNQGQSRH